MENREQNILPALKKFLLAILIDIKKVEECIALLFL